VQANRNELAEIFEVSVNTIDLWLQRKGMPYVQKPDIGRGTRPEQRQWVYDVAKCVNWRIDQARGWGGW
jgi:phage terminase Nu1 subunit (DNA packaging protein)